MRDELKSIPEDPARVIDVAERFVKSWFGASPPLEGYERDDLRSCESCMGVALPVALREFYARLGHRADLVGNQDPLSAPSDLYVDASGVMVIREENQKCALWGINVEECLHPDPPVHLQLADGEPEWVLYHERLSISLLEILLEESMLSESAKTVHMEGAPDTLTNLPSSFESLGIPRHPFWAMPDSDVVWYGSRNTILRSDGAAWLWATSSEWGNLDRLRQQMPGEWMAL